MLTTELARKPSRSPQSPRNRRSAVYLPGEPADRLIISEDTGFAVRSTRTRTYNVLELYAKGVRCFSLVKVADTKGKGSNDVYVCRIAATPGESTCTCRAGSVGSDCVHVETLTALINDIPRPFDGMPFEQSEYTDAELNAMCAEYESRMM